MAAASRELAKMGCSGKKKKIHVQHVTLTRGGLILDGLIKVECAECGHCDTPEHVIKPVA